MPETFDPTEYTGLGLKTLSTGLRTLDSIIGGGIPQGLTVIHGPVGCGKSTLASQISRAAKNPRIVDDSVDVKDDATQGILSLGPDGHDLLTIDSVNLFFDQDLLSAKRLLHNAVLRTSHTYSSVVAIWQDTRKASTLPRDILHMANLVLCLRRDLNGVYTVTVDKCRDPLSGQQGNTATFRMVLLADDTTRIQEVLPPLHAEEIPTVWDILMDRA